MSNTTGSSLEGFSKVYLQYHGYISVLVSLFGILTNSITFIVLTHRSMRHSVTNVLLAALAVADGLTMASYLPYATHYYIMTTPSPMPTRPRLWVDFIIIHSCFTITTHSVAMWLTVSLAIFRYITLSRPTKAIEWCSMSRARLTIFLTWLLTITFCIPNYLSFQVVYSSSPSGALSNETSSNQTSNETSEETVVPDSWIWIDKSHFATAHNGLLHSINFWILSVAFKLIPCVLLTVMSSLLIRVLHQARKRKLRLLSQGKMAEAGRASEHNRTTAMLLVIVLFFLTTELPLGVIYILSGIDEKFFSISVHLGDILDLFIMVNSSTNFILYCVMSTQFRDKFAELFIPQCCSRSVNVSATATTVLHHNHHNHHNHHDPHDPHYPHHPPSPPPYRQNSEERSLLPNYHEATTVIRIANGINGKSPGSTEGEAQL